MSGGYFDYAQYRISQIAEDIDTVIFNNGSSQLDEYGDRVSCDLPPDIIEEFKRAANAMRLAYIYAQRCDWLLSGDDGEDSFRARLRKDLAELRQYEVEMVTARDYDALQSLNAELLEALEEVAGDLFLQIEPKHGARAASQYPSFVKARAAIAKARMESND